MGTAITTWAVVWSVEPMEVQVSQKVWPSALFRAKEKYIPLRLSEQNITTQSCCKRFLQFFITRHPSQVWNEVFVSGREWGRVCQLAAAPASHWTWFIMAPSKAANLTMAS